MDTADVKVFVIVHPNVVFKPLPLPWETIFWFVFVSNTLIYEYILVLLDNAIDYQFLLRVITLILFLICVINIFILGPLCLMILVILVIFNICYFIIATYSIFDVWLHHISMKYLAMLIIIFTHFSFYNLIFSQKLIKLPIFLLLNLLLPIFIFSLLFYLIKCLIIFLPKIVCHPSYCWFAHQSWIIAFEAVIGHFVVIVLLFQILDKFIWLIFIHIPKWVIIIIMLNGNTFSISIFMIHSHIINIVNWIDWCWCDTSIFHFYQKISNKLNMTQYAFRLNYVKYLWYNKLINST